MRLRALTLVLTGALLAAAAVAGQAFAGAETQKGELCILQLSRAPGHQGEFPDITAEKSHSVQTNSQNDNSNANCHGQLPQGTPGPSRALVFSDVPCATATRVPGTGDVVITPSGRVNFTCHFKS